MNTAPSSINRKIFRAAAIVTVVGVVSKVAAICKEIVIAHAFGRGDAVDAYQIAFLLPTFLLSIGMGSLSYSLVPVFVEARQHEGEAASHQLLGKAILIGSCGLLAVTALLALLAPLYLPLVGHGFSATKIELTRKMLYTLLPWVFFSGFAFIATAALNATERFALPAIIPMLTSAITVALILIAAKRWGVFTIAYGTVAGSACESMFLFLLLWKDGLRWRHFHWGLDPRLKRVLAQYAPMLAGSMLMGSTTVVDQAMAAMLPAGNVAALGYANRLIGGLLSVGGLSLSTATLPYFSKMVAANDWAGCRHTLKRYSTLVVLATVPFTLLLIAASRPIIASLYQHGAFTMADTLYVSRVQVCYALQIPFFVWSMLFVRFITAVRHNQVLMYASLINLIVDIILNLVLMRMMGVAGIALSTSLVYMLSFVMVATWSVKFLSEKPVSEFPLLSGERL